MTTPDRSAAPARVGRRPGLRARLALWGFVAGVCAAGAAAWVLRGQFAPLHGRLPSEAQPVEALAPDAGGISLRFAGWRPIFHGIDLGHGETPLGRAGTFKVDALRIRLDEPGVRLVATPGNGDAPLETYGESALAFLERHGLSVAVNTHFFHPCCEPEAEAKELKGLAVAAGQVVSPPEVVGNVGDCVLVVDPAGHAEVLEAPAPPDLSAVEVAVAGSDALLRDGTIVAPPDEAEGFRSSHPRTAAGVSADGRTLYLLTIDGRQIGWSNGATLRETAAWLRLVGADDGLNLDGGGSTTMVRSEDGRGVLVNRPVGLGIPGTLRWNGSHLGAVAAPLVR